MLSKINSTVQNTVESFPKNLQKLLPNVILLKLMSSVFFKITRNARRYNNRDLSLQISQQLLTLFKENQ